MGGRAKGPTRGRRRVLNRQRREARAGARVRRDSHKLLGHLRRSLAMALRITSPAFEHGDEGAIVWVGHLPLASASQNSASPDTELWSVPSTIRSVATSGGKAANSRRVSASGTSSS